MRAASEWINICAPDLIPRHRSCLLLLNPTLNPPAGWDSAVTSSWAFCLLFFTAGFCEIPSFPCPDLFVWSISSVWSLPHTPLPCQTTAFTCVFRCFPCDPSCGSASWATPDFSQRSVAPMVKMTRSKTFQAYLPSCHRTYSCIHCRAHLANHDELISKVGVPSRCTSVAVEVFGLIQLPFSLENGLSAQRICLWAAGFVWSAWGLQHPHSTSHPGSDLFTLVTREWLELSQGRFSWISGKGFHPKGGWALERGSPGLGHSTKSAWIQEAFGQSSEAQGGFVGVSCAGVRLNGPDESLPILEAC